jgi:propionyl-CoA carboxylase beta chain
VVSTHSTKSGVAHILPMMWMSGRFETLVELFTTAIKRAHNLPYELNDEVRTKLATIIPIIPTNRTICTRLLVELLTKILF